VYLLNSEIYANKHTPTPGYAIGLSGWSTIH